MNRKAKRKGLCRRIGCRRVGSVHVSFPQHVSTGRDDVPYCFEHAMQHLIAVGYAKAELVEHRTKKTLRRRVIAELARLALVQA